MKVLATVVLAASLTGCVGSQKGDDYFWFRSEGADMPVWVRGQRDSSVFVVFLQGGPGNPTQMVDAMFPEMTADLDQHYGMVYYDQRASGISVGNASPETLSLEQYAEDLDVLVDILHSRYEIEHLFLWGVSWGGTLGNHYLSDPQRQAKIAGWIEMDGGDNMPLAYEISRPKIMDFATAQIAAGTREGYWRKALDYYEENEDKLPPPPQNLTHYNYVFDAGGYFYDPEDGFDSFLPYMFSGPFGVDYFSNQSYVDRHMDIDTINLHPELGAITVPALVIWGENDLVVPVEVGQLTYEALGTAEADKTLLILENTAHTVPNEAPAESLEAMHAFISGVVD